MREGKLGCAIVGYGPVFNWGWMHTRWMRAVPELEVLAICDRDPECAAKAARDFPDVAAYTDLGEVLARPDVDLVAVVTPHNTHADLARRCLGAGKHTVVEKPMCLNMAEADAMVAAARVAGRTLAVYHNRRHDGNVRAIKQIVDSGVVGQVFHIEVATCGYSPDAAPAADGGPWRTRKEVSGGVMYDWGAHAIDWVLSLVGEPLTQVTGFVHKFRDDISNEDQVRAIMRFAGGCVAEVMQSRLAFAGKPFLWYILGTEGALVDTGHGAITGYCQELNGPPGGSLRVITAAGEREVPYLESDWATYYHDLVDHLLRGAPVPVSGEDGRRVIGVLEAAGRSAAAGHSLPPLYP